VTRQRSAFYKILGFFAWKGFVLWAKGRMPSRRVLALGFVAAAVTALAVAGAAKREIGPG
jgi:hypothetical protein